MKKRILKFLSVSIVLCFTVFQISTFAISLEPYQFGDMNGDGKITIIDALYVLQIASGRKTVSPELMEKADVNKDGKVTALDALQYLQYMAAGRILLTEK
jgi:hypothetical protein